MKKAVFDDFADVYDEDMALQPHLKGSIEFYIRYAEHIGGPILDLGCGTGRIAIPLLQLGYEVEGIEISSKMLEIFMLKMFNSESILYCVDALKWKNPKNKKYKLIIMADDVLLHFLSSEQQQKILKKCRSWLTRQGLLIIDIFRQHYEDLARYKNTLIKDGISRIKKIIPNFETQINKIQYHYPNGKIRTDFVRWISEPELYFMIKLAGLKIVDCFGNYDKSSLRYKSPKMIFVLKK